MEVDYIGVIIGDDLLIRDGKVLVNPKARDEGDRTIFGWKSGIRNEPSKWEPLIRTIIKNTYRTLLTRGMKGCYVYCTDPETARYFKSKMTVIKDEERVS